MKNPVKWFLILLASMSLSASLSACISVVMPEEESEAICEKAEGAEDDRTGAQSTQCTTKTVDFQTTDPTQTARPIVTTMPVTTTPVTTAPLTTAPVTTEPIAPEAPTYSNVVELKDYLLECIEEGNLTPTFQYDGDIAQMRGYNYANVLCVPYYRLMPNNGQWTMTVTQYPGDRMLAAYRSGDYSALTDDEYAALEIAVRVVEEAVQNTSNVIELELYIHDWMLDRVTYDDRVIGFTDPSDLPRHLTALGALLDGSANCQGYTDAFYLMASLAGLKVDRQFGVTSGGDHLFNTICIDGEWYVVDLTYNDSSIQVEGEVVADYRLFNAGLDRCTHEWEEAYEHHPISAVSGSAYYYYLPIDGSEHGYEKAFDNLSDMGMSVANAYLSQGRKEFYLLLLGQSAGWADLRDALKSALDAMDARYTFTVWASKREGDTYYVVRFD